MQVHLRKYNEVAIVDFVLFETDGIKFKINATSASADVNISRDEQPVEQLDDDSFAGETPGYSLELSAAEMSAKRIIVYIEDQGTKTWLDTAIIVETYGHASAQHAFDLDSATVTLADGGLTAAKIGADAITEAKIANDAVAEIVAGLKASTGWTVGGTATFQAILKALYAQARGKVAVTGDAAAYNDDDDTTTLFTLTFASTGRTTA